MSDSADALPPAAPSPTEAEPALVRRELVEDIALDQDRLPRNPRHWVPMIFVAILVGAGTGMIGSAFRIALLWSDTGRERLLVFAHAHGPPGIGWLIPVVVCAAGAGLGGWLAQRFSPETAGSGIPRVEAVLRSHLLPASAHVLPVKFAGGVLAIGSGLALGREGPMVQMGGTLGRLLGSRLGRFLPEPWTLIAAGAGAGLAVAFNAPLAAALFVSEELLRRFSARVFVATIVACIVATTVSRGLLSNHPDFQVRPLGFATPPALIAYLVLGGLAGLAGIAFNVMLLRTLDFFSHPRFHIRGLKGAIAGASVGAIAWHYPALVGGGEVIAQHAITLPHPLRILLLLLLARWVLTMLSYACGAPGGILRRCWRSARCSAQPSPASQASAMWTFPWLPARSWPWRHSLRRSYARR